MEIPAEIKAKLSKVYELVNRGSEGEKEAAKAALERLLSKYNIDPEQMESINRVKFKLTYTTVLEEWLFIVLADLLVENRVYETVKYTDARYIQFQATYEDGITLECAYEYFRRHMKGQWNKLCAPHVKRCRTSKTKNRKRKQLQEPFFNQYCIASKLFKPTELRPIDWSEISKEERETLIKLSGIEGGEYNRQVESGLFLGTGEENEQISN